MRDDLDRIALYSRKHVRNEADSEELRFLVTSEYYNFFSDRLRKRTDSVFAETVRKDLPHL